MVGVDQMTLHFEQTASWPIILAAAAISAVLLIVPAIPAIRREDGKGPLAMLITGLAAAALILAALALAPLRTPGVLLIGVGTFSLTAAGLLYRRIRAVLGVRRWMLLLTIRAAIIILIILLLFKPVLTFHRDIKGKAVAAVLIDASRSMSISEHANTPSRFTQAFQSARRIQSRFRAPLEGHFFRFSAKTHALPHLHNLAGKQAKGEATNLALTMADAAGRFPRGRLAAIVILSDFIQTADRDPRAEAKKLGVPVYTVPLGSKVAPGTRFMDIAVAAVDAPAEAISDNICRITARITSGGFTDRAVKVSIREKDKTLQSQRLVLRGAAGGQTVEFKWTPKRRGPHVLTVSVPVDPAERIPQNNSQDVHVLVTNPRIKVLLIEGATRPEYRFLRRVLTTDPNVELMTLVQTAPEKFIAGGTVGGKPLAGWPSTPEQFARFDVFILGDLDRSFLTKAAIGHLRDAVRAGKGFLMLGGQNTFGPGGYADTPIEQILPVFCGPRSDKLQDPTPFHPALTAAGMNHPIFTGLSDYFASPDRKASKILKPLRGCVIVPRAKPGAEILAINPLRRNKAGPLISLAVQRFGAGRTAALTVDTTWVWRGGAAGKGKLSPFDRFWGQLIRWIASAELKKRPAGAGVTLLVQKNYYLPGESVRIKAKVRDHKGRTTAYADVKAVIDRPGIKTRAKEELTLKPDPNEIGLYRIDYEPPRPGDYRLILIAEKDGKLLGEARSQWTVGRPSAEFDRLSTDFRMARDLAELSGGQMLQPAELTGLLDRLTASARSRLGLGPQTRDVPLFHFSGMFFAVFVLISIEWLLRRRWQLV